MKWLAAVLLSAGAAAHLAAQAPLSKSSPDAAELVTVVPKLSVRAPGEGSLDLRVTLAPGWHVNSHQPSEEYLIATAATLDPADGVRFGEATYPPGKMMKALAEGKSPLPGFALPGPRRTRKR